MSNDGLYALHWRPEKNSWVEIDWGDFAAFRELFVPFKPLSDVSAGVHYFVVCACGEGQTFNIIPHKYLVETNGKIGRDNFYGWNREEREDYNKLMISRELQAIDQERLSEIRAKAGNAMYPPRESLYPLVRALPFPLAKKCAAINFLDTLAVEKTHSTGTAT